MKKRPISVTLIAWLFIVSGAIAIVYHAADFKDFTNGGEALVAFFIRLSAIVGGYFVLRGANWARWLLIAWISYHVILSLNHTIEQLITHAVLTVVVIAALFHRSARSYFRQKY